MTSSFVRASFKANLSNLKPYFSEGIKQMLNYFTVSGAERDSSYMEAKSQMTIQV